MCRISQHILEVWLFWVIYALVEAIHEIEERSRLDTLFDQNLSATSFEDIDLNGVGSQGK